MKLLEVGFMNRKSEIIYDIVAPSSKSKKVLIQAYPPSRYNPDSAK